MHGGGTPQDHLRALVGAPPLTWRELPPLAADLADTPMRFLPVLQWRYHSCGTDASLIPPEASSLLRSRSSNAELRSQLLTWMRSAGYMQRGFFGDKTGVKDIELAAP